MTFKSQLEEEEAGQEVEADPAGGWLEVGRLQRPVAVRQVLLSSGV